MGNTNYTDPFDRWLDKQGLGVPRSEGVVLLSVVARRAIEWCQSEKQFARLFGQPVGAEELAEATVSLSIRSEELYSAIDCLAREILKVNKPA